MPPNSFRVRNDFTRTFSTSSRRLTSLTRSRLDDVENVFSDVGFQFHRHVAIARQHGPENVGNAVDGDHQLVVPGMQSGRIHRGNGAEQRVVVVRRGGNRRNLLM